MIDAIRRLGSTAAARGGELIVHYSGHGCRAPTLVPGAKGERGLDEGIVPYDWGRPGARILHDVELAHLFGELRASGVRTTLVFDACHSGGLMRDEEGPWPRGARRIAGAGERRTASEVATISELETSWRRAHGRELVSLPRPSVRVASETPPVPKGATSLIAACRDRQSAYELVRGGRLRGALTWCLLQELEEAGEGMDWPRLQARIGARLRSLALPQTPTFEGTPSPFLLGRTLAEESDAPDLPPAMLRVLRSGEEVPESPPYLAGKLTLDLASLPPGFEPGDRLGPAEALVRLASRPRRSFRSGEPVCLTLVNTSPRPLYSRVYRIDCRQGIRRIYEDPEALAPEHALRLIVEPVLPADVRRGRNRFVAIGSTAPIEAEGSGGPWTCCRLEVEVRAAGEESERP
jgi:hypothetical protein